MPTISVAGSSAVFPLIEEYSNTYNSSDIVAQAGGSGLGINVALNNTKNIGMASKNPNKDPSNDKTWTEKRMKTITIAWDAIGVVYKSSSNDKLDITKDNIGKIYKAFAGYESISYSNLTGTGNNNSTIKTFARDGGSEKSGTADAFYKDSNFADASSSLTENEKNALKSGMYGKNVVPTAESNSQAWDAIKSSTYSNSMIYLSSGFILKNMKEISSNGFKVATYNGIELEANTITIGYDWYRPLNLITSLNYAPKYVLDFISWTIDINNKKIQKILSDLGYTILTQSNIESMAEPGKQWWESSDSELGWCGAR